MDHAGSRGASEKVCDSGNIIKLKPTAHAETRGAQEREKVKVTPKCLAEATGRRGSNVYKKVRREDMLEAGLGSEGFGDLRLKRLLNDQVEVPRRELLESLDVRRESQRRNCNVRTRA